MISKGLSKHDRRTYQYQTTGTMYPMSTDMDKVERKRKKKEWYTDKGRYESVKFVEATPDGRLKKEIQKAVKKNKMKIEVVEKAGVTVKRLLQKSNPFEINKCGYEQELVYTPNSAEKRPTKKNNRKRKIIWFNPPFSKSVSTNVGKSFLNLVNKHFPPHHKFRKLFNKNTIKVSYSCMPSMKSKIKSHNIVKVSNNKISSRGIATAMILDFRTCFYIISS